MKTIICEQGSTAWMLARAGVVSASEIDALVTPLWAVRKGEGVQTYLYQKLAERLLGYTGETGSTFAMDQGHIIEKIALPFYTMVHGQEVQRVGFVTTDDGRCGCSPDGLLGEDGGIEVKAPQGPAHLRYLLAGEVPPQYRAQVQFSLWVTKRAYWRFMSFSVHLPPLIVRVEPDPKAFEAFDTATAQFLADLDAAQARIAGMMQTGGRAA